MTISTLLGDGPTDLWIDGTHGRMFVRSWFPERDALRPNHAPILLLHESLGCIEQWKDFPSASPMPQAEQWSPMTGWASAAPTA